MNKQTDFSALFEEARKSDTYWTERVLLEFTEEITSRMEALGVTRAELARRLNAKPTYITRVLNGTNNFTVESMARISKALDCALRVHMQPQGTQLRWLECFDAPPPVEESFDIKAAKKEYQKLARTSETPNEDLAIAS
jgi:transcriptional regulator with XRE-family HTH domain